MAATPKSTDRTVFVRFVPASALIRRHHVEDIFSEIGPIRKSSVIHDSDKSYGFVKFVEQADAEAAVRLDGTQLPISSTESSTIHVQLASAKPLAESSPSSQRQPRQSTSKHKAQCRLMIRNLAFSAKAEHVRETLEQFGVIDDIHIPAVPKVAGQRSAAAHRGFGFVEFRDALAAHACVAASGLSIAGRPVQIVHTLNKTAYEQERAKAQKAVKPKKELAEPDDSKDEEEKIAGCDGDDHDSEQDNESDNHSAASSVEQDPDAPDTAVREKRSLFLRNLPFDATRHDLFELLRPFGTIQSIHLVTDRQTGIPKGTAFVAYKKPIAAAKAHEAAAVDNAFVSQQQATTANDAGGLQLKGRRILVDFAVDKSTAETLTVEKQSDKTGKDRRHLYLKAEGRVDGDDETPEAWQALPAGDQLKRQRAWSDKNTKLRSPLFFINPNRLSIRNLAKAVDEADLKKLCVTGIERGMAKGLVSDQDQIAYWKASGEKSTREILAAIKELEERKQEDASASLLPAFDAKNVKRFLPSVYIDREFKTDKKAEAASRGFGFVEFEYHVHALACLRELNNNTAYSAEYVVGGKQATVTAKIQGKKKKKRKKVLESSDLVDEDGRVKIPRLIVEFTVENKAKAKQQAEHRAQQQANIVKQKTEHPKSEEKKKRGARQRERKRKAKEEAERTGEEADQDAVDLNESSSADKKESKAERPKGVKPTKKRKLDPEEAKFTHLVEKYKQSFAADGATESTRSKDVSDNGKKGNRWFE